VVAKRYATGRPLAQPALSVTSPTEVDTADGHSVRVTGTTSGRQLYVGVNGGNQPIKLTRGSATGYTFDATVTVPDLHNQLVIVAVGPDGGTNTVTRTVLAYGDRVGGLTDPSGDDNGPGTYVYPTADVYKPGTFDLTGTDVYTDGDNAVFVTTIAGDVFNPWGGDQISLQRINLYLGNGDGATAPALPGTNLNTETPWDVVVVQDGRFDSAGVYAPDGTKIADVQLRAIPETRQIAAIVPRSALGSLDLTTARYGVAMFGNAEPSEGIGFVRPVYDLDYWNAGDP